MLPPTGVRTTRHNTNRPNNASATPLTRGDGHRINTARQHAAGGSAWRTLNGIVPVPGKRNAVPTLNPNNAALDTAALALRGGCNTTTTATTTPRNNPASGLAANVAGERIAVAKR